MKSIFPGAYFGNIDYFKAMSKAETATIDLGEHWVKQTLRTRCKIIGANGPMFLSVPVIRPNGSKTSMKDVVIDYKEDWTKIHWKTIESAYSSAPFFEAYDIEIHDIVCKKPKYLKELQEASTSFVIQEFELPIEIEYDLHFYEGECFDYRSSNFENEINHYISVFERPSNAEYSILDLLFNEGPMTRNFIIN
jgi:hypothetical protein